MICLKTPEASAPNRLQNLQAKLKQYFACLHSLLVKLEQKILNLLRKIAEKIRRYWECLMIPTEILILLLQKLKQQSLLSCNES